MKRVGVAILGLGVVGGGTYDMLQTHREFYKTAYGLDINVEGVLEVNDYRIKSLKIDKSIVAHNIAEICSNPLIDIVVEVIGGIEPAKSFVLSALNSGKSVVTSNKELFCKHGRELEKTAKKNNCGLYYEATCVGGVPVIRALSDNLQGNEFSSLIGIINGTTNYVLSKMSEVGLTYGELLKEAQNLGYAESDPTADVEGYDAAYKLSILSSLAFKAVIPYERIYREGITNIKPIDVEYGKKFGYVLKLLAICKSEKSCIDVRVHPAFLKREHPLAAVSDSYNAVYLTGDYVGNVMLYGRGAGAYPTASAIVGDIIYCASHENSLRYAFGDIVKHPEILQNFKCCYYLRISVQDKTGMLSKITTLLSAHGIGVAQVVQEQNQGNKATVVIVTHETCEQDIKDAVSEINSLKSSNGVKSLIRIA